MSTNKETTAPAPVTDTINNNKPNSERQNNNSSNNKKITAMEFSKDKGVTPIISKVPIQMQEWF